MGLFRRSRDDGRVIDLRDHVVAAAKRQRFGMPTRCPACNGVSRLEMIDVVRRTMAQRCVQCGLQYDTTEAELEAANARLG